MYRTILLIVLSIVSFSAILSQSTSVEWLKYSGGSGWERANTLEVDESNNIYVAGNYSSGLFDNDSEGEGSRDMFISKYDSLGHLIWTTQIKNSIYCNINQLLITENNQLIASGMFKGTIQLGDFTLDAGISIHEFILSIDLNGSISWVKQYSGNTSGLNTRICSNNKSIYLASSFRKEFLIDNIHVLNNGSIDIVICKIDLKGKLHDHKVIEGLGADIVNSLVVCPDETLYVTGSFEETLLPDDLFLYSEGMSDVFLLKLDHSLNVVKAWSGGSIYNDQGKSVILDKDGEPIIGGLYSGPMKLATADSLTSYGNIDVFLIHFDNDLNVLWKKGIGGLANDYLKSIGVNSYNDIFAVGQYRGTINKDNYSISSKEFSFDIFLYKCTNNGTIRYLETIGDNQNDYADEIKLDRNNEIILNGNFKSQFLVNDKLVANSQGDDYFLAKLYDCDFSPPICLPSDTSLCQLQFLIEADSTFSEYYWNSTEGNNTWLAKNTGIYVLETIDRKGCHSSDSIYVELKNMPAVNLGPDLIINPGSRIILSAGENLNYIYSWDNGFSEGKYEIKPYSLGSGVHRFEVEVTGQNGCKASDDIFVHVAETPIDNYPYQISIYPNPTKHYLNLIVFNPGNACNMHLNLISVLGEITLTTDLNLQADWGHYKINLSGISPGTYYVNFLTSGFVTSQMLVVQ